MGSLFSTSKAKTPVRNFEPTTITENISNKEKVNQIQKVSDIGPAFLTNKMMKLTDDFEPITKAESVSKKKKVNQLQK